MKFHHYGVPTNQKLPNEIYIEHLKMYISGFKNSKFKIEKMRLEKDADFPEIVKTKLHLAFEVDNIQKVILGKMLLL